MTQRLKRDPLLNLAVMSTLSKHEIVPKFVAAAKQSKLGYPGGGDIRVKVLLIYIDVTDRSTDTWLAARKDVELQLQERGFEDLAVEMIGWKRFYQPSLFPIFSKDPLVTIYESKHDAILEIVEASLGQSWTSVSFFKVGTSSRSTQHAIVIMVKPLTEHDWSTLQLNIENPVNAEGSSPIGVEFMPGYWGDLPTGRPIESHGKLGSGLSFVASFSPTPAMGTSIELADTGGAASLGGFFNLYCHGKRHSGFLTNSHIVQPTRNAPDSLKVNGDQHGHDYLAPKEPPKQPKVHYFAAADVATTKLSFKTRIEENMRMMETIHLKIQKQNTLHRPIASVREETDQFEAEVRRLQSMMTVLNSMPRSLGKVLYASGRVVMKKQRMLDWAFIEIPECVRQKIDFQHGNLVPNRNVAGLFRNGPSQYKCRGPYLAEQEFQLRGFNKAKKDHWYFKIGRTTGITTGVCNGVLFTFRRCALHPWVRELVIVNAKSSHEENDRHEQQTFCREGDCGTLLVDRNGYVAGLLWGEMVGWCGPFDSTNRYFDHNVAAGIVTDIGDVVSDALERVGGRLEVMGAEEEE